MICILALIVFSIMGIFSATHRKLAAEAFDCVFRRMTLRKCQSGLDIRIKSQITGKLMQKNPVLAKLIFRYFEAISWAFVILTVWSVIAAAISGYNYYAYGNCNGPVDEGFCIFDPLGEHSKFSETDLKQALSSTTESCKENPGQITIQKPKVLSLENVDLSKFFVYDKIKEKSGDESDTTQNKILFIGCYSCSYTREAYPAIKKLMEREDVDFVFAHFPAKSHSEMLSNYAVCIYRQDKEKLLAFSDLLFNAEINLLEKEENILDFAKKSGADEKQLSECINSDETKETVQNQIEEIKKTGVYGTPTVFVNGNPVVGPKQYRVYTRLLK